MENKNKDGVQYDIQHRADEHAEHGGHRFPLGTDEGVQAQGQLDEDRAQQIDADVAGGIANGGVRGAEGPQDGLLEGAEAHRQHCGGHQQQGQRVAKDPLRLVLFSRPQLDGGQRSASLPGKGGKGGHQRNDGKGHPHPGQCQVPHLGDVADVDAVHDVVQHVDELGGHRWYGQLQHQTADGCRPQHI